MIIALWQLNAREERVLQMSSAKRIKKFSGPMVKEGHDGFAFKQFHEKRVNVAE